MNLKETAMGAVWYTRVAMNRPRVKLVPAVRVVLDEFDSRPPLDVVEDVPGAGILILDAEDSEEAYWPSAVRITDLPDEGAYPTEGELDEAEWELHEEQGQAGLVELLARLSTFLESPLTIRAATFTSLGEFGSAKEWTIQPGATAVEVKEIDFAVNDVAS